MDEKERYEITGNEGQQREKYKKLVIIASIVSIAILIIGMDGLFLLVALPITIYFAIRLWMLTPKMLKSKLDKKMKETKQFYDIHINEINRIRAYAKNAIKQMSKCGITADSIDSEFSNGKGFLSIGFSDYDYMQRDGSTYYWWISRYDNVIVASSLSIWEIFLWDAAIEAIEFDNDYWYFYKFCIPKYRHAINGMRHNYNKKFDGGYFNIVALNSVSVYQGGSDSIAIRINSGMWTDSLLLYVTDRSTYDDVQKLLQR